MVRYLCILLVIISCSSSYKNEFGRTRQSLNIFSFKATENIESYKIIDTSCFYKLVLNEGLITSRKNRFESLDMIEGLKFYKNGRVGYFKDAKLDSIKTLNPKKAIMGLYKFSNNKIYLESIVKNPQMGSYLWKEIIFKKSNENGIIIVYVLNNKDTVNYNKVDLP